MTPTEYDNSDKKWNEFSLAEQCFITGYTEDVLFDKVNEILGCNTDDCLKEGFIWGCHDVSWDEYDNSIEVIRDLKSDWMSRDQADEILKLGFGQIYESIGEEGRQITKTYFGKCSARKPGTRMRYKAIITAYRKKFGELDSETLKELENN